MTKPTRSKPTAAPSRKRRKTSRRPEPATTAGPPDRRLFRACLWLAAVVAIMDQLSKWAALAWLTPHVAIPVVPYFNLTLAFNSGAAFSFLSDAGGWQRWLFIILAGLISAFLWYWLRQLRRHEAWTGIALGLILGGALGNVLDRLFRSGQVVDFIDVYYRDSHWPAFNLADSAISLGAAIIVIQAIHEAASSGKDE